jgi:sugar lactone lactonase YvrE/ketosteroid isomerase-like protein
MVKLVAAMVASFWLVGSGGGTPVSDPVVAVHEAEPRNGIPIYLIARSHARRGDAAAAAEWLGKLLELNWDQDVDPDDFAMVAGDTAFRQVAAALDGRALRVGGAEAAVRFEAQDLVPEGIAWDPRGQTFLVGSGRSRKILAVGRDGVVRDRTAPAAGGALAVAGVRVDETRGQLWAATSAAPFMEGFAPEAAGRSLLVRYDLASGGAQRAYPPPEAGSLLNDIAVDADGVAYVTDTAHGTILRTDADGDALAALLPSDTFLGPNGIAVAREARGLFVADFHGVAFVELPGGLVRRLPPPPGIRLGGIDGLYVWNPRTLVGVQNLVGRGRVWRLELDAALTRVESAKVLSSGHPSFRNPTTGAVVGDDFYLLANPQLQTPRPDGGLTPLAPGARYEVLRIPLGGDAPSARPDAASLRAAFDAWIDAWNRRDIPAIAAIGGGFGFGRDVPFARRGAADRAGYEQGLAGYMDLMEVIDYEAHHTEVEVSGDTGLVWGFYAQTTQQKGGPLRTVYGRQSLTFLWRDGGWRLAFYHRSALPNEFVR